MHANRIKIEKKNKRLGVQTVS